MSRIVGIYSQRAAQTGIQKMLNAVKTVNEWKLSYQGAGSCLLGYVGNEDSGVFSFEGISLVIDGTIYNQSEISKQDPVGVSIVNLYKNHGFEGCIQQLNGDFSFALYDEREQTLWIARDRVGVKPMYYTSKDGQFAFASRPKSLLQLEMVSNRPNSNFVARFAGGHYRYIDNIPSESPYQDISQLPAAHILRYNKGEVKTWCYWKLEQNANWNMSENELAEEYRSLLSDAVNIRLAIADKPAFTLSGGMDSSSVLASAVKQTGKKQHAFSSVYVDKTYDESDEIASMLDSSVEEWHRVVLNNTPDVFENVRKMIAANDEPVATATWLSHFLLCEEVKNQGFGSLFGGLGGDELNAGEYEYFFMHFADLKANGQEGNFLKEVDKWSEYHDHPIFRKNLIVAEDGIKRMTDLSRLGICLPERHRMLKYAATVNKEYFDFSAFNPRMVHPFTSYLKNRTYQDIFYETAPCCLRAEDRQTMAFGLENFVPFFDYRLLEFMFRVPGELKIRDGVTKILLREAMSGILPDETRARIKKTGWNAPAHKWFSGNGLVELNDMVHSQTFRQRGIYNIPEVEKIIAEHDEILNTGVAKENHMMFLWQMVNLELWLSSLEEQ